MATDKVLLEQIKATAETNVELAVDTRALVHQVVNGLNEVKLALYNVTVAIEKQQRVAELQAKSISEVTATAKMQSENIAQLIALIGSKSK